MCSYLERFLKSDIAKSFTAHRHHHHYHRGDNDNDNGNNNNIHNSDTERRNSRFCTINSLLPDLSLHTLMKPRRSRLQIRCNTLGSCHVQPVVFYWAKSDSSAIHSDRLEIAFIFLSYRPKSSTSKGGGHNGVHGENS